MRWSTQHVDAVAVDGQHRLAAIKRFLPETRFTKWESASLPVIFLIADERVGFRTPHGAMEKTRTVSALRSVFIDLNKNAKAVSPTRNILLDDLDVVSVSVRSLIGRSLGDAADPDRIPLALVDWLTDRNKIDDGPFLTTVMLLHEATKRLLEVPDMQLDEDDDSVDRISRLLREVLPPADAAAEEEIMTQVRICARSQSGLNLMPPHGKTLLDAYDVHWRPHFRKLFRDFTPYGELRSYFEKKDLAGARFVNLYVAQEVMREKAGKDQIARLVAAAKREIEGWSLEKC